MQIQKITNINFKENIPTKKVNSENSILLLRDPNASIKFRNSQAYAKKADSVETNPIVALGYKLYRSFNLVIKNNDSENKTQDLQSAI